MAAARCAWLPDVMSLYVTHVTNITRALNTEAADPSPYGTSALVNSPGKETHDVQIVVMCASRVQLIVMCASKMTSLTCMWISRTSLDSKYMPPAVLRPWQYCRFRFEYCRSPLVARMQPPWKRHITHQAEHEMTSSSACQKVGWQKWTKA